MNWKERFTEAAEELQANPRIQTYPLEARPITEETLARVEKKCGAPIPDRLREVLLETGSMSLKWRSRLDPRAHGNLSIGLNRLASNAKGVMLNGRIQYHFAKDAFVLTAPYAKDGASAPRKGARKLASSIDEVLELLLKARGFTGWAHAYLGGWTGPKIDLPAPPPPYGLLPAVIPDHFEGFDLASFGKASSIPPLEDTSYLPLAELDLSEGEAGRFFEPRLRWMTRVLRQDDRCRVVLETRPPVTDEEIDEVQRAIGYPLDPRFLAYFRSTNGLRFFWVRHHSFEGAGEISDEVFRERWDEAHRQGGGSCGGLSVPSLREIFTAKARPPVEWDNLRLFALHNEPLTDELSRYYDVIGALVDERVPDPVLKLLHDHVAATGDHSPVRARTFFEWALATGARSNAYARLFENHGAAKAFEPTGDLSKDHPLRETTPAALERYAEYDPISGIPNNVLSEDDHRSWER